MIPIIIIIIIFSLCSPSVLSQSCTSFCLQWFCRVCGSHDVLVQHPLPHGLVHVAQEEVVEVEVAPEAEPEVEPEPEPEPQPPERVQEVVHGEEGTCQGRAALSLVSHRHPAAHRATASACKEQTCLTDPSVETFFIRLRHFQPPLLVSSL